MTIRRLRETTPTEFTEAKGPIKYPPDHQPGLPVPKGGSMCANCKFLRDPKGKICGEPNFIAWNGGPVIDGEIDAYCSDWYMPR